MPSQQQIGDFDVLEVVGQGTVGTVYRARHRRTGAAAAIKLLKDHVAREPDVERRFVREVAICEKLDHPNVVRHLDCGLHEDRIYFAMELVGGGTLKEVLRRRRRLPWREAVEVAVQVCAALEYAHQLGIIHRDLKPGNLFLSNDGRVKVGDFGLARDLDRVRLTLEGTTVGTCRYMPPEQIAGEAALTGAVDLYALGCILFEMLTGRTPFDGETIVEIFEQHLELPPPDVAALVPDCPSDLADLIELLLAKDPRDRPSSAAVVERSLSNILQGRPIELELETAHEIDPEASTADLDMSTLTERLQSGPAADERRLSPRWWMVILAAILIVIVVIVIAAQS